MRFWFSRVALILLTGWVGLAHATLTIEITQRLQDATPIAVVPFGGFNLSGEDSTADIIRADLDRSGKFASLDPRTLPGQPTSSAEILPASWQNVRADLVVVGNVTQLADGRYSFRYELLKKEAYRVYWVKPLLLKNTLA